MSKSYWHGNKEIEFIWNGNWADPQLKYKGYIFNYWDIEDAMWDNFLDYSEGKWQDNDSGNTECENEYAQYVRDNGVDYLEDVIFGGYFDN